MKAVVIAALTFVSGAAAAFGQPVSVSPTKGPADFSEAQAKQRAHIAAVANCEQMWDRGTHMSVQEWARACRRVQSRLKLLDER